MTNLQVQYNQLLETRRNNEAQLAEAKRHNQATESLTSWKTENDLILGQGNLAVNQLRQAEDARHNLRNEGLQAWSNAFTQAHLERADQNDLGANAIKSRQMQNDYYVERRNLDRRDKELSNEQFKSTEQSRHNRRTEAETFRNNSAYVKEQNRHNVATEQETIRHNKKSESLQTWQNVNGSIQAGSGLVGNATKVISLFK